MASFCPYIKCFDNISSLFTRYQTFLQLKFTFHHISIFFAHIISVLAIFQDLLSIFLGQFLMCFFGNISGFHLKLSIQYQSRSLTIKYPELLGISFLNIKYFVPIFDSFALVPFIQVKQ